MTAIEYISNQLQFLFPPLCKDLNCSDLDLLLLAKDESDDRFSYLANQVSILSRTGVSPNPLHIMKSPIYLYILAVVIFEKGWSDEVNIKNRLYCLNKAINGCSIYYKIKMPRVFFLNYASGIVLGNCVYGENLVVYQGVTVGGFGNKIPVIGNNVILMPNVVVSGASVIGDNVVISAGVNVINKIVPDNTIVFNGAVRGSELNLRKLDSTQYIDYYINSTNLG